MKHSALIELDAPGIVLFDPAVLERFLSTHQVLSNNVFDCFLQNPALGRAAIEEGVVCPIYQIPEREYSVFVDSKTPDLSHRPVPVFTHIQLPLQVCSGTVIVADLNALLDWDAPFFTHYREHYDSRLPNNDYLDVDNGLYDLTLSGYSGLQPPFAPLGYGLQFNRVSALGAVGAQVAVDDRDFVLC